MEIAALPELVSDVLLDVEATPLWTAGLEHFEWVSGDLGEPGCVGLAHYREGGRRFTVEDRLLEVEPGRHFKSEIEGGGLKATVTTDLERIPEGTRITIRWAGSGTNPITWLMLPLMRGQIEQRSQDDLRALKELVEARAASGSVE